MSANSMYSLEPTTRGAIKLITSAGDIIIQLFSRECPLAVRNFCQLCVDGRYKGAPFHRVVADTLVQAGFVEADDSSFEGGAAFKDEFHSRLEFRGRGFVAYANEGRPNSNKSQFFITLKPCAWLNRKHTIFGIVKGEPVYVAIKIGTSLVDGENAIHPYIIKEAVLLEQPFPEDPIVARSQTALSPLLKTETSAVSSNVLSLPKKKPAVVLSFDDDDETEVQIVRKVHPSLAKQAKKAKVMETRTSSDSSSSGLSDDENKKDPSSSEAAAVPERDQSLAAKLAAFAARRKAD